MTTRQARIEEMATRFTERFAEGAGEEWRAKYFDENRDTIINGLRARGVLYLLRLHGCSDGHCEIAGRATGMHTNGGCRCLRERDPLVMRVRMRQLFEDIRTLLEAA